jgi:hypothetical protein
VLVKTVKTYKVVRYYREDRPAETIKTGLTLEEAKAHCKDPETSSSTAKSQVALAATRVLGEWFDGWTEESNDEGED